MPTFQILHISDLHITSDKKFDQSVVLDPLIARVKEDIKDGLRPDIVVVTGDIARAGLEDEYKAVNKFLVKLRKSIGLDADRLFIVPGNHDVYRPEYRPSEILKYDNMKELNDELENEKYRGDLLKGMDDYFMFIGNNYGHLKSKHGNLVPFVTIQEVEKCGKRLGLVGLNSAWMCRKSPDNGEISIGEYQIKNAMEELKELEKQGTCDLKIIMFHHPYDWLWLKDQEICRKDFDNSVLLVGHLHERAKVSYFEDDRIKLFHFQAGASYEDSEYPNRFQFITLDWDKNIIRLNFRRFNKDGRAWVIDNATGKEGVKEFTFSQDAKAENKYKPDIDSGESTRNLAREGTLKRYKDYTFKNYRELTMQGFETTFNQPIEIENVYINMRAHSYVSQDMGGMEARGMDKKEQNLSSIDIKQAFDFMQNRKIKDMVILGKPGSGKTTLLKYILLKLISGEAGKKIGLHGNLIPFYAPLRELKDPARENFYGFIRRVCELDKLEVSEQDFKGLLDSGNAIILLDGLDEVSDANMRQETCNFIENARNDNLYTKFIITSRYAGYQGETRLKGNRLELSILDFTQDEVREFLVRWFAMVETAIHFNESDDLVKEGKDKGERLFEKIEASEYLQKLAVNPLLLQIIALVHMNRGLLPERRVELYSECTNVLLEKWDMAKGLKVDITAMEARKILQPLALWLHETEGRRSAATEDIKPLIAEPLKDIDKPDADPEKLLLNIRDRSGLLMGYSDNEYGFAHLGFQEYLAAEEIRNRNSVKTLVNNYSAKWWKEVILLALALDNPSIIVPFMEQVIKEDGFKVEIDIVVDAIKDSVTKPLKPFIDALSNSKLDSEARYNVVKILEGMSKKGTDVNDALKGATGSKDEKLAALAYEALKKRDADAGIKAPGISAPSIIRTDKDDSKMLVVPAGPFLFGSKDDDSDAYSDEKPQRVIDLPAYYIDKFPVTNKQYCRFLNEKQPDSERLDKWINLAGSYEKERCRIKGAKGNFTIGKGFENHPVIYVSWFGAKEYAEWSDKRLPTEQEWEKAARGTDGQIYPWSYQGGNLFNKKLLNNGNNIGHTTPVDRYADAKVRMAVMIWSATSGNGLIVGMIKKVRDVFCAAARGTSVLITAAVLAATGTSRATGSTTRVFVAPGLLRFSSFTLLPFAGGENEFDLAGSGTI